MPVRKLRSIDEATSPDAQPLDGRNIRAAMELSELCHWLRPWRPPAGVHRNVSIEAAQARRRAWEGFPCPS